MTFVHPVSAATSITVTGLTTGLSYAFRVSAVSADGRTGTVSAVSDVALAASAPGLPGTPVIGARSSTSVALSWSAGAANGSTITDYVVEYQTGGGAWVTYAHPVSSATSITVEGLTTGLSYAFRVSAVSGDGRTGTVSAVSELALTASAPGAPGAPGKLKIGKRTTSSIALTWSAAVDNGSAIIDHIVEYRTGAGAWLTFTHPQPITSTATTVTGLTKGVQYTFRVTAVSAAGAGAPSAVSKLALAASAPGAPQSLVAKPNGLRGQLVLTWKPAAINGAPTMSYSVKWLRAGKWVLSVKVKGALTYTIKGLPKGAPQTVCVTVKTIEGTARVIKAGIILK